jgi:diguanylate cyclase (GGDEF)-like protein
MVSKSENAIIDDIARLLMDMLQLADPPQLPKPYRDRDELRRLHKNFIALRKFLYAASNGDLSMPVPFKGYIGGTLKALQANLKHLTWQTKMVASGDFSQRVEFMGEFSQSFNSMVTQLDQTLKDLTAKEQELSRANADLRKEIEIRKETEEALRKNEEAIRRLAITDSLTGLYNRRHFNKVAEDEIARAIRYNRPLSVMMFDIDFFKQVNDTHGHLNGDEVLKTVARVTKENLRTTDILARYGGEEFIILLTETTGEDTETVAERLRACIEQESIQGDNCQITVTASFGVSYRLNRQWGKPPEKRLMEFIESADQALYLSKEAGRNRVTVYKSEKKSPHKSLPQKKRNRKGDKT